MALRILQGWRFGGHYAASRFDLASQRRSTLHWGDAAGTFCSGSTSGTLLKGGILGKHCAGEAIVLHH